MPPQFARGPRRRKDRSCGEIDLYGGMRSQWMLGVEDESELLGEERPAIETLPAFTQVRGDSELGLPRLEKLDNLRRGPAQQFDLQAVDRPARPRAA